MRSLYTLTTCLISFVILNSYSCNEKGKQTTSSSCEYGRIQSAEDLLTGDENGWVRVNPIVHIYDCQTNERTNFGDWVSFGGQQHADLLDEVEYMFPKGILFRSGGVYEYKTYTNNGSVEFHTSTWRYEAPYYYVSNPVNGQEIRYDLGEYSPGSCRPYEFTISIDIVDKCSTENVKYKVECIYGGGNKNSTWN